MKTQDNNEIVDLFKISAKEALELCFKRYYYKLNYFGRSLIDDRWVIEEMVDDAFVSLWKRRDNFFSDRDIRAFLYIHVRNACFSYTRKLRSDNLKSAVYLRTVNETTDENNEAAIDYKIIEPELLKSSDKLSAQRKQIFDLIFNEGLTTQQIARKLDLSASTIRAQKFNIINQLNQFLIDNSLISCLICFLGSL
jgi:RNA polymerase sigma factor (sigma-70 family)